MRSGSVKAARRLLRRRERRELGRFLVEGPQAVRESLALAEEHGPDAPGALEQLFAGPGAGDRHPELLARAEQLPPSADRRPRVVPVDDEALASLAETVTPQGLVGVARLVTVPLASLPPAPRLVLVLADVRDPGNAGAGVRVADAAGADAVVCAGSTVDLHNGKAVRASAGSLFHLPVVDGCSLPDAVAALHDRGLRVLAADGRAPLDLDEADDTGLLSGPVALVVGNEAAGLDDEALASADAAVRVPLHGRAESLNVATATAVCLYAAARAHRRTR